MNFQLKREEEKRKHVEQQVTHVRMDEAAREHCEVLLFAQEVVGPEQAPVDQVWHSIQADKAGTDSQGHDGWGPDLSVLKHRYCVLLATPLARGGSVFGFVVVHACVGFSQ